MLLRQLPDRIAALREESHPTHLEPQMSEPAGDVRTLIEQIAKALVDAPGEVLVYQVEDHGDTIIELEVAPNDMGKVIGKHGRTAKALRCLLNAAGARLQRRYELEILE